MIDEIDLPAKYRAQKQENARLRKRMHKLEHERDAAVADLKKAIFDDGTNSCTFCAHQNQKTKEPYCLANFCNNDEWAWRGSPKEATNK